MKHRAPDIEISANPDMLVRQIRVRQPPQEAVGGAVAALLDRQQRPRQRRQPGGLLVRDADEGAILRDSYSGVSQSIVSRLDLFVDGAQNGAGTEASEPFDKSAHP